MSMCLLLRVDVHGTAAGVDVHAFASLVDASGSAAGVYVHIKVYQY
jgi:hypothetical protein